MPRNPGAEMNNVSQTHLVGGPLLDPQEQLWAPPRRQFKTNGQFLGGCEKLASSLNPTCPSERMGRHPGRDWRHGACSPFLPSVRALAQDPGREEASPCLLTQ